MPFTKAEAKKEICQIAKKNGLTFKRTGDQANNYAFFDRKDGSRVTPDYSDIFTAYEDAQGYYIESYNPETKKFGTL